MKSFIYTKSERSAKYGSNVTLSVYYVKNNTPQFIGSASYNTGSYRGEDHEAANVLLAHGLINRNTLNSGGYINRSTFDKNYKLTRLS